MEIEKYLAHLPTCNKMQDWSEAYAAFSDTPEILRGHDYNEALDEMNKKAGTCTCGMEQVRDKLRQAAVSGSLSRREAAEAFVRKYHTKIGIAIMEDDEALKKDIVKLARIELGHKKTTWWIDVFRGIETTYERGLRGNDR